MKHVKDKMIPAVLILVLLVIWEAAVDLLHIPLYVLPSPLEVVKALFTEGAELFSHGLTTVGEGLLGILIASALSLVLGISMDWFPGCAKGTLSYSGSDPDGSHDRYGSDPDHLYGIWNGTEDPYGSSYVFLSSGSQFCRRTAAGRRRICTSGCAPNGADRWKAYCLVKIPAALPELFSGLKVAATYSISGAVVGEWLGSQKGLGYYLLRVKNSYMLDKVFACVVVIILLSLAMNGLIRVIAKVSMPYERNKRS